MKIQIRKGLSFGLTSSVITTLGLIIGLNATTHSRLVVIGGILTIAVADSLSDALAMHISEESENQHSDKQIWAATFATMFSKAIFALIFLIPVLLFSLNTAIITSIVLGLVLLSVLSYFIAKKEKISRIKSILEHLTIATIVIVATHYVGYFISLIG
jgi:VIT1/CCC1 family predicted Fe2+/Mn2+ transporter|tara:strand:+ start:592 stop:1065 length:474 start_codon:yes stop_codon:yes gene_type:complete